MRSTLLLAVLACSCEAWRVPAASAHATARRNQRTPALTPRRSALLMSEDSADDPVEAAPPPSAVRLFLARHATRYATPRATPHHMSMPRYHAPCLAPRTAALPHHRANTPGAQGTVGTGRYADRLPRLSGCEHHVRVDRGLPDRRRRLLRAGGARQVCRQEPFHAVGVRLLVVVSDVHRRWLRLAVSSPPEF